MARTHALHRYESTAHAPGPAGQITEHASDNWRVREEAKNFLSMILRGLITLAQARADILMTDKQAAFLLRHEQCDPAMLRRIKWRREWTWKTLLGMYYQAIGNAVVA